MKPVYLEFQAFGPFVNKEKINFEDISENGIFLVKGPTGSGKTTIFDAMTFALYGGASGEDSKTKGGRNSLEKWRCSRAPFDAECYVKFIFISGGRKYSFTRKSVRKRKNLAEEVDACYIDDEGIEIPLFDNPKIKDLNEKAEELIGLNKEQFRQVILLPQGKFERFLTADAAEKEVILSRIFNTGKWQTYADNYYNSAYQRKNDLDDINKKITDSLKEEDVSDLQELLEKIESKKKDDDEIVKRHESFNEKKKSEELEKDKKLYDKFCELNDFRQRKEDYETRKNEIDKTKELLEAAEKADNVRSYLEDAKRFRKELAVRENDLKNIISQERSLIENKTTAAAEYRDFEENSVLNELKAQLMKFTSKIEYYKNFSSLQINYDIHINKEKELKKELDKTIETEKIRADEHLKILKKYNDATDNFKSIRTQYYNCICGQLAVDLVENKPCPVCGSREHPLKAELPPDSVSKEDVDIAEKNENIAKISFDRSLKKLDDIKKNRNERNNDYNQAKIETVKAKSELDAAKKMLEDGIPDETALLKKIDGVKKDIDSCHKKSERLLEKKNRAEKALNEYRTKAAAADDERNKALEKYEKAVRILKDKLSDEGISDEDKAYEMLMDKSRFSALKEKITKYETNVSLLKGKLEEKEKELAGLVCPDPAMFEIRQKEIDTENMNYYKNHAVNQKEIDRLTKKYDDLLPEKNFRDENIQNAENDLAFAKRLRGDSGVGLQRYVLGIMFNQVVNEANNMLRSVHESRYQLYRSDTGGNGKKKGLELYVRDSWAFDREGRSVSTLSGGEKFLVSMALSIGLSAVARQSGIKTEALFIDEGFGTLDRKSIDDAMNVLEYVKSSNGIIGIISHVELLEENITKQIEVVKSEHGSSIKIC